MKKIILIGCGGHAKSTINILEDSNEWIISGLVGLENEVGEKVLGYSIFAADKDLAELRKNYIYAFLSIGQIGLSNKREELVNLISNYNFEFPILKARSSVISKFSTIKEGTFIGNSTILSANSNIGRHCIINTNSVVEHDVIIDDFCHISTGVIINGGVKIGKGSFVGSGTIIREGLKIPPNTVISAGKRIMGWPLNN